MNLVILNIHLEKLAEIKMYHFDMDKITTDNFNKFFFH